MVYRKSTPCFFPYHEVKLSHEAIYANYSYCSPFPSKFALFERKADHEGQSITLHGTRPSYIRHPLYYYRQGSSFFSHPHHRHLLNCIKDEAMTSAYPWQLLSLKHFENPGATNRCIQQNHTCRRIKDLTNNGSLLPQGMFSHDRDNFFSL